MFLLFIRLYSKISKKETIIIVIPAKAGIQGTALSWIPSQAENDKEVYMEFKETTLKGAYLIKPQVFQDERGFFLEDYSKKKFKEAGIDADFVQDNHSLSVSKGVLRGLHYQLQPNTQAKLVRVTRGSVYDVIVDLRKDSVTYGKWEGFELSAENFLMLFVPQGFAHGFCTLEDNTEFQYKCDNFYVPESEAGIIWNDPTLNVSWPIKNPILSEKDAKAQKFSEFNSPF